MWYLKILPKKLEMHIDMWISKISHKTWKLLKKIRNWGSNLVFERRNIGKLQKTFFSGEAIFGVLVLAIFHTSLSSILHFWSLMRLTEFLFLRFCWLFRQKPNIIPSRISRQSYCVEFFQGRPFLKGKSENLLTFSPVLLCYKFQDTSFIPTSFIL